MPKLAKLMTVPEAAAALRVSNETIRRMVRSNDLPGTMVGRQYRVFASSVEAKLQGGEPDA